MLRSYSVSLSVSVCQNMSQSRAATSIRTTAEGWRVLVRDPVMQDSTTEATCVYKRITGSGFGRYTAAWVTQIARPYRCGAHASAIMTHRLEAFCETVCARAFPGSAAALTVRRKSDCLTNVRGRKYQNTVCFLLIDRETVTCAQEKQAATPNLPSETCSEEEEEEEEVRRLSGLPGRG